MRKLRFVIACCGLTVFLLSGPIVPSVKAQRASETPEEAYSRAFQLYSNQMYLHASQAFERFRHTYPDHPNVPEAMYHQAEALLTAGREDEAMALYERFQSEHPAHPLNYDASLTLGIHFFESGRYSSAIAIFAEVLEEQPPAELAAQTLYWMGEASMNQNRPDAALEYFRRAAEDYRNTSTAPLAMYTLGFNYASRGNYDESARAFELLAARYPDSPYARDLGIALAETYYELGDFRRAISEIQRRLPNLGPEDRDRANFLMAESYNQLRESQEAIVYYRRFTEANPDSPYYRRSIYGLAWNYHFEGAYQWAAENFERVRTDQNDNLAHRAMYYEAANLRLDGQLEEAARVFEGVTLRWPDGPLADRAVFERGMVLYEMRQWQRAASSFRNLVERYPNSEVAGEALRMLGEAHIAVGEYTRALEAYDAAIDMDAADPSLREQVVFQRAWLMYRGEQYSTAATSFRRLYDSNPQGNWAGEALFWAAESHFQTNELSEAARLFTEYLRNFPTHTHAVGARYALAWTYFRQGSYTNAIQEYERFLSEYTAQDEAVPYRADARLRLADSYYAQRQYTDAIRAYSNVRGSGEDYALYQIGQSYTNMGRIYDAITSLRRLLDNFPYSAYREEALYAIGFLHFENQDYSQAIAEYSQLIQRHPNHPLAARAQYGIGDAHFNSGRMDEALEAYEQVLERYPRSRFVVDAVTGIQYVLVAEEREDDLDRVVDDFAARNPDSPVIEELRFRQAEVKYQSGRLADAISDFQRFVRTSSSRSFLPAAYFYMGMAHYDLDQREEAENYLQQVITQYPTSRYRAEAARQLGDFYLDENRYTDALQVYRGLEQASDDQRAVAEAKYGQGMSLLGMGRTQEAEDLLTDAIAGAPDAPESVPARLGLARVLDESGRNEEAVRLYQEIVDRDETEFGAEALYRMGVLHLQRGDARAALSELGRLSVLFTGYPEWLARGYLAQARAYRSLGQRGDADRMYEIVISDFSHTDHADVARREKAQL